MSGRRVRHPGRTLAQRRALDAIGCGNFSPMMARSTRDALLKAGLIVKSGFRYDGAGHRRIRIDEYAMPIPVHMQWCDAVSLAAPEVEPVPPIATRARG